MKVITSGYASLDRIFKLSNSLKLGETSLILNDDNWTPLFGGCSPNIAYNLAKLGVKTYPIMRVGNDFESSGYRDYLLSSGLSLDYVSKIDCDVTPFCFLFEDSTREHTTVFYTGSQHPKHYSPIDEKCFKGATYGVITVGDPKENMEFLQLCKKHNVKIAFGMRKDLNSFPDELLKAALSESTVLFMNSIECDFIEKHFNLNSINDLYKNSKAEIIVVTQGKGGSRFSTKDKQEFVHVPAICTNVVDSAGAGDAFMSGFIYGLLNNENVLRCAQMGTLLSSLVIQAKGCTTNTPNVADFLKQLEKYFTRGINA